VSEDEDDDTRISGEPGTPSTPPAQATTTETADRIEDFRRVRVFSREATLAQAGATRLPHPPLHRNTSDSVKRAMLEAPLMEDSPSSGATEQANATSPATSNAVGIVIPQVPPPEDTSSSGTNLRSSIASLATTAKAILPEDLFAEHSPHANVN
jgi:hypothetical protein